MMVKSTTMPDGRILHTYTLTNKNGLKAEVSEYGATLISMMVPDRDGNLADVTLGYDTTDGWLSNTSYFGSTVGRFGNRIAHGKFSLDGKDYQLATNNSPGGIPCSLHGGKKGFDKVLWSGEINPNGSVSFTYHSEDGEEGYPGNLTTCVTYTLTDDNELKWEVTATTDAPTIINICHHSYWNLSGDPSTSINDHLLQLDAPHYLPTDAGLIPTDELKPVAGTPMDFTEATAIGKRVDDDYESLKHGAGYDHCWVLKPKEGIRYAGRLEDPKSGRVMELFTDQPAIQFYGGNFLDGTVTGKGGIPYPHRSGLCLESENFPDAPNKPHFPSCVLRPNQTYKHTLIHKFSTK